MLKSKESGTTYCLINLIDTKTDETQGRDDDVRSIDTPLVYQNLRGRLRDVLNVVLVCEARARNHFSRTVFQFGTNERFLVTSEHVFRSRSGRSPGSPLEIDVLERRRRRRKEVASRARFPIG